MLYYMRESAKILESAIDTNSGRECHNTLVGSAIDTPSVLVNHHPSININITSHHSTRLFQPAHPNPAPSTLPKPLKHIPQIIPCSNRHPQMSQDTIRARHMKMEIQHRILTHSPS